jgi:MSHA pilin protein MshD
MNKHRQAGITLVELIISIVVISIALVGIFLVINLTTTTSANPVVQYQAIAIAESYMEEILLQAYCNPIIPATCAFGAGTGPDSAETRATYNDVDDYNGLSDSGALDSQGNAIALLSAYTILVKVDEKAVASLTAKLITVTVTGPGIHDIVLTGYAFLAG